MQAVIQTTRHIALVGNPNVGKSVIFNSLTGMNQKIANFPGVTLTYLTGSFKTSNQIQITDLPGIYGFVSTKLEEKVSHQFLIQNDIDLVINVVDARKLERNLALTLQLQEFGLPMIVVISHVDTLPKDSIAFNKLSQILGTPVFGIDAHQSKQYEAILKEIMQVLDRDEPRPQVKIDVPIIEQLLEDMADEFVAPILLDTISSMDLPDRAVLLSVILSGTDTNYLPTWLTSRISRRLSETYSTPGKINELRTEIISAYYSKAESIVTEVVSSSYYNDARTLSQRLDRFLVHPKFGPVIFGLVMYLLFALTFSLTSPFVDLLDNLMKQLAFLTKSAIPNDFIASLLSDGIIGGVGFVLVFLPQIFVLFAFISFLEYSGYLARAVYIMDKYLEKIHISGTSIAPLLLGFGCNVPGVMATKSISDPNEKIVIGMVNPFMSCSARLPVYMVIASAIFPNNVALVVTSLYFLGILLAVVVMFILRQTILPGESQFLILEIPDLSIPKPKSILHQAYRHSRQFLHKAASWMALGLLLIWLLSITGPSGYLGSAALDNPELIKLSWIYFIGSIFSPLFIPLGWDVRLIVALIMGFIAKEIVIGSLGLLYGGSSTSLSIALTTTFTPISAYAFLVFVLIYTPCIGTYYTMRSQLGSKWANLSVVFSISLAYVLALLVTLIGNILV